MLRDAAAAPGLRSGAARRLLQSDDAESRARVLALMASEPGLIESRGVLLREVAQMPVAPAWLLAPLQSIIDAPPPATGAPDQRAAALAAMGSIRTREGVEALIGRVDGETPELARAAMRALGRLTGRSEFGIDPSRWRAWFTKVQWLPESEWRQCLADGLARGIDAAQRERERAVNRLIETLQREYLAIFTPEERTRTLAQFLGDEMPDVRRLGVQLARQELANARVPGPAVGVAVMRLLADPSPEFRKSAAELLGILPAPDDADGLVRTLTAETDPGVAEALLRAVARAPSPAACAEVMRWLSGGQAVREAAVEAAAALQAATLLTGGEDCAAVLGVLRSQWQVRDLSAAGMRLLCVLGDESDRASLAQVLSDEDPSRRLRAADALGADSRGLDPLLVAAADEPMFFNAAARSSGLHRPNAEGYLAVAALPSPESDTTEARQNVLLELASKLSVTDLVAVAERTEDAEFRERLLARLTSVRIERTIVLRPAFSVQPELVSGLLLLARTRLSLGLPAAAIAALDVLEPVAAVITSPERVALRTTTLLWLGRVDEAAALGGPIGAWVDGLDKSIELPHAKAVLAAIDKTFGPNPGETPEQVERLQELREKLTEPAATPAGGPPPVPETPPK